MRRKISAVILVWASCFTMLAAISAVPIATITPFPTKSDGQTVFAADWNTIANITTWLNNTLLSTSTGLNCLNAKGDIYVFNGTNLQKLAVGTDNTLLQAASGQASGLLWASVANLTALTTKGDICGFSTVNTRIPVGANGTVLTADSTLAAGAGFETATAVPIGGVIAWSPLAAGTSTIPTNFALCDGLVHNSITTPNLIGRFILGTQPSGGGATPSAGGYGTIAPDTVGGATTVPINGSISYTIGSAGVSLVTAGASNLNAYDSLVYICRVQ